MEMSSRCANGSERVPEESAPVILLKMERKSPDPHPGARSHGHRFTAVTM